MATATRLHIGPNDRSESAVQVVCQRGLRGRLALRAGPGSCRCYRSSSTFPRSVVGRVAILFMLYADEHPGAINYQAGGSECRVRAPGMRSDRHPDQAIYLSPPPDGEKPWTYWIPDIVVEVVSRGGWRRDYQEKREEYLRIGVRKYWIVDPARRAFMVLRRAGDTWEETPVSFRGVYRTPLLPGLEVRPAEILGTLDK
jgi:Uma2 family endonuclease